MWPGEQKTSIGTAKLGQVGRGGRVAPHARQCVRQHRYDPVPDIARGCELPDPDIPNGEWAGESRSMVTSSAGSTSGDWQATAGVTLWGETLILSAWTSSRAAEPSPRRRRLSVPGASQRRSNRFPRTIRCAGRRRRRNLRTPGYASREMLGEFCHRQPRNGAAIPRVAARLGRVRQASSPPARWTRFATRALHPVATKNDQYQPRTLFGKTLGRNPYRGMP